MFVYNNTVRLINPGAKLPLLPGENKLDKQQAAYLLTFNLDAYLKGRNPMLTISDAKIMIEEEDKSVADKAAEQLKAFVQEGGASIVDATDGVPEEGEGSDLDLATAASNAMAARIAAAVSGG